MLVQAAAELTRQSAARVAAQSLVAGAQFLTRVTMVPRPASQETRLGRVQARFKAGPLPRLPAGIDGAVFAAPVSGVDVRYGGAPRRRRGSPAGQMFGDLSITPDHHQ